MSVWREERALLEMPYSLLFARDAKADSRSDEILRPADAFAPPGSGYPTPAFIQNKKIEISAVIER